MVGGLEVVIANMTIHAFMLIAEGGSMLPEFDSLGMVLIANSTQEGYEFDDIKEGDVIAFDSHVGKIMHRVVGVHSCDEHYLTTQGDANNTILEEEERI
jgi:hypothetical protein